MAFWHQTFSDKRLFQLLIPGSTPDAGKFIKVWNCRETCGQLKTTIFTSIVYIYDSWCFILERHRSVSRHLSGSDHSVSVYSRFTAYKARISRLLSGVSRRETPLSRVQVIKSGSLRSRASVAHQSSPSPQAAVQPKGVLRARFTTFHVSSSHQPSFF